MAVARCIFGDADLRAVVLSTWLGAFLVAAAVIAGLAEPSAVAAGVSGYVVTALGVGGLVGALALIRRPPRCSPSYGLAVTTALLGGCCLLGAVAGIAGRPIGLVVVFGLVGLVNAPHTVLSLAAREEQPPVHLRREVFIAVAGTKVAFSSLGTVLAGLLIGLGPNTLLIGLAGLAVLGASLVTVMRRRSSRAPSPNRPSDRVAVG